MTPEKDEESPSEELGQGCAAADIEQDGIEVMPKDTKKDHSIGDGSSSLDGKAELPALATAKSSSGVADAKPGALRVPWIRQFQCMFGKNVKLLSRRPILTACILLSGIVSVLLAWAAGRGKSNDIYPELDACGGIANYREAYPITLNEYGYYNYDRESRERVKLTRNETWRGGWPLFLLSLGPLINAVCAYLVVHNEHSLELLGSLRALGLRTSAYCLSWYAAFALLAAANSILAAIAAKAVSDVHVFEHVGFGVFFLAQLMIQLAAISSAFFLVAICGSRKNIIFTVALVSCMIAACCLPFLFLFFSNVDFDGSPGSFWKNQQTTIFKENLNFEFNETSNEVLAVDLSTTCPRAIVSEEQAKLIKDPEEQLAVGQDEMFLGCYFEPSWPAVIYNENSSARHVIRFISFFFNPFFHFTTLWGNFLGYTALPGNSFSAKELSLSIEDLAREALPGQAETLYPNASSTEWMMPQYSMVKTTRENLRLSYQETIDRCPPEFLANYNDDFSSGWNEQFCNVSFDYFSRCPATTGWTDDSGQQYDFCDSYNCRNPTFEKPTDSPSSSTMIWYLVLLSVLYTSLAVYLSQVFPGANGKPRPFYFPFMIPLGWAKGKRDADVDSDAPGVNIDSISKSFGATQALRDVSFAMNRGVIALLGHNGAGKTTLAHIICCDIAATSGDASVFGRSITEDPDAVRRSVGLCQQDDYLWPNLSAKEHLDIFATLRGVPKDEHDDTVQKWLASVELSDVQLQYSSAFSGGMKRRLSVALSTIGKRPLIMLDEPTTGMDPVSRRSVWRHIDEIRKDCVVILTTHGMDEADLLADEVAIMKKGELVALGTPLQLKSEHGSALIFSLIVPKEQVQEALALIQERFASKGSGEWVTFDTGNSAGNITVRIHKVRVGDDNSSDNRGVHANDLSEFVAWMEDDASPVIEYGFSNSSLEEVFLKVTGDGLQEEQSEDQAARVGSSSSCRCCCPSLSASQDVPVDERGDAEAANSALGVSEIASFMPKLGVSSQSRTIFIDFWKRTWLGCGSVVSYIIYGILLGIIILMGLGMKDEYSAPVLFSVVTVFVSVMLLSIIAPIYSDRAGGMFYLMRSQGMLPSAYLIGTCAYSMCIQLLYTAVVLVVVFFLPVFHEPKDCALEVSWRCYSGYGETAYVRENYVSFAIETEQGFPGVRVSRSPGGFGMIVAIIFAFALSIPGAVLVSGYLPGFRLTMIIVAMATIAAGFGPFFDFFIVDYRKCQEELDARITCEDRTFTGDGDALDYLDCVGYFGFGMSEINCPSSPAASILPQFGLFRSLTSIFFANLRFHSESTGFVEETLIPSLKGVSCSGDTCHFPHVHAQFWSSIWYMVLGDVLLFILGMIIALVVTFPNRFVSIQKQNLFDLLCCTFSRSRRGEQDSETSEVAGHAELSEVTSERKSVKDILKPFCEAGNSSFLRQPVEGRDDLPPVLTHNLKKIYPALGGRPPKVALKGLDIHVPKNEVLGFLGKNGAGKSTALKILSGAHESSNGLGLIGGYDCKTERLDVFERLGYCAQFDVIWANRSVQRHLEFFAALKGLPRGQVATISHSIAKAVGLGMPDVYRRSAGALSGGMRRRLSIAMSLIGSPVTLILDEPTTGLDPSTRNSIWNLIGSFANEHRGVVITTHMMIEADTLCSRIAIIADGELKVIGTQQHLKNEYGSGYSLQLNLTTSIADGGANRALSFVRRLIHPDAQLHSAQAKSLTMNLPRDTELQRVFSAMYSPESASEGCINQFLLSQSSLEDVFIAFGE